MAVSTLGIPTRRQILHGRAAWECFSDVPRSARADGGYAMGVCKCSGWSSGSGSPLLPNLEVVDSVLVPTRAASCFKSAGTLSASLLDRLPKSEAVQRIFKETTVPPVAVLQVLIPKGTAPGKYVLQVSIIADTAAFCLWFHCSRHCAKQKHCLSLDHPELPFACVFSAFRC